MAVSRDECLSMPILSVLAAIFVKKIINMLFARYEIVERFCKKFAETLFRQFDTKNLSYRKPPRTC
jgi:hypothetical protein